MKTSENHPSFTIQLPSKKITHFTNLNFFDIENNMLPKHSQKAFSVYKCSSKHVSVWSQRKHLLCTISWSPRTTFLKNFESKLGKGWKISLGGSLFGPSKMFYDFSCQLKFSEIQLFFSFRYFHQVLKRWNFPDNS